MILNLVELTKIYRVSSIVEGYSELQLKGIEKE
jgi:hypothetical protein